MPSDIIGKTFTCAHGFLAGVTEDDAERIQQLIDEDDKQALRIMMLQGRCIGIKRGYIATVEDVNVWKALERFHVRGYPGSFYTRYGMIE